MPRFICRMHLYFAVSMIAVSLAGGLGCSERKSPTVTSADEAVAKMVKAIATPDVLSISGTITIDDQTQATDVPSGGPAGATIRSDEKAKPINFHILRGKDTRAAVALDRLVVHTDGTNLRARAIDEPTHNYLNQFVVAEAPKSLDFVTITAGQDEMARMVNSIAPEVPTLLDIFLAPTNPLSTIKKWKVVDRKTASGHMTVEAMMNNTRWIIELDQQTGRPRRFETTSTTASGETHKFVATIDKFERDLLLTDEHFHPMQPDSAIIVKYFVRPPLARETNPHILAAYDTAIDQAGGHQEIAQIELPQSTIHKRTDPAKLDLKLLWTYKEFDKAAGNILALPTANGKVDLYVNDGLQSIVHLDKKGQQVKRINPELPKGGAISYLQAAYDIAGLRVFAGSAIGGRQVFVYDHQWKSMMSYPPANQPHDGIGDILAIDFKDNGHWSICVGFWGELGVHNIPLDGKDRWRNRGALGVQSLAPSPLEEFSDRRKVLASDDHGLIVPVNAFGNNEQAIEVENRIIARLVAAAFPPGKGANYLGQAVYNDQGRITITGLRFSMEESPNTLTELWSYQLPKGIYNNQIRPITSGRLVTPTAKEGGGQWVIAAPDGSVHVISADGRFNDFFYYGKQITGITITEIDGQPILLVATADAIEAWQVNLK